MTEHTLLPLLGRFAIARQPQCGLRALQGRLPANRPAGRAGPEGGGHRQVRPSARSAAAGGQETRGRAQHRPARPPRRREPS